MCLESLVAGWCVFPEFKFVHRSRSLRFDWSIWHSVLNIQICLPSNPAWSKQDAMSGSGHSARYEGLTVPWCEGCSGLVEHTSGLVGSINDKKNIRQEMTQQRCQHCTLSALGCNVLSLQINLLIDYSNSKDWHGLQTNISRLNSKKLEHCKILRIRNVYFNIFRRISEDQLWQSPRWVGWTQDVLHVFLWTSQIVRKQFGTGATVCNLLSQRPCNLQERLSLQALCGASEAWVIWKVYGKGSCTCGYDSERVLHSEQCPKTHPWFHKIQTVLVGHAFLQLHWRNAKSTIPNKYNKYLNSCSIYSPPQNPGRLTHN